MGASPEITAYRTKAQIVIDALRERIQSGDLAPGDRVVLRPLAEAFACSEIPVREAVRHLAAEGLIEMVPHGGARVALIDASEVIELTEIRARLEPHATRMAAEAMPPEAVATLRDHLVLMQAAMSGQSERSYSALNRDFHRAILAHCPNRRMDALINDLWNQSERGRVVHLLRPGHMAVSFEHHCRIVEAIAARQFDEVEELANLHSAHGVAAVRSLQEMPPAAVLGAAARSSAGGAA